MSLNSLNFTSDLAREKEKVFRWAMNWLNDNAENKQNAAADIPDIIVLFQCLGFVLHKFEAEDDYKNTACANLQPEVGSLLKLELTCSKSGMKAEMSKAIGSCKCPSKEDTNQAQFWSITGCGPANQDRVDVSLSSLLPKIPPTKTRIVTDILNELLQIVNGTDINQNDNISPRRPSLERHRSLDTLRNDRSSDTVSKPLCLSRKENWEVDPKTSPPVGTSSPVPDLCRNMDQISLNYNTKTKLEANLRQIIAIAENSLEAALGKNSTFTKDTATITRKRVSDIKRRSISDSISPNSNVITVLPPTPPAGFFQVSPKDLTKPQIIRGIPIKSGEKRKFASIASKVDTRRFGMSPTAPTLVKSGAVPRKPLPKPLKHRAGSYVQDEGKCTMSVSGVKSIRKMAIEGSKLQKPKIFGSGTSSTKL